ncbi:CbtB-domain containing protein [Aureimonas fodinaquatilis]|uniref:CbtB-domain containing protein n=1 Tax=Aureimonas fodinaquatilis TaxID=2565783 RepID=A0A5B0DV66_9HYPH|nr:CbtB-domain containing protein [Aureimonas fodinaquatilis]KAA0970356.1 CbtB-domain containing protein [Aureimonas fodinaquatilis]
MSDTAFSARPIATPIPLGQYVPWAIFGTLLMLIALYFVSSEEGALQLVQGVPVHEFLHDGRHLLGFPCH